MSDIKDDSIIVTYWDPCASFGLVEDELKARLPLRNLHWNSSNRPLRSIQTLHVSLEPLNPDDAKPQHQMPGIFQKPYLNLCFVFCEDVDTYRTTVRRQIRDWYNGIVSKRHEEWLIVHVLPKASHPSPKPAKGNIFEKIRADFNVSRRDRVVQVRPGANEADNLELWGEFAAKMKEGILDGFDGKVAQYEDDIRRLQVQQSLPGWNYCTFFILKEGLALSFEHMALHEDALSQYAELEALFLQLEADHGLTYFSNSLPTEEGDDSASVLSSTKKPYRDMILQNSISSFDLKCYLFARQAQLLLKLQRPLDLIHKSFEFLRLMSTFLTENKHKLYAHFLESFVYSACTQVLDILPGTIDWAPHYYASARGDLLNLAREQLDSFGNEKGYLPSELSYVRAMKNISLKDDDPGLHSMNGKITNKDLCNIVCSQGTFLAFYLELVMKTINEFGNSDRNIALNHALLNAASIKMQLSEYQDAAELLSEASKSHADLTWPSLHTSALRAYATCLSELERKRDYLFAVLGLLGRNRQFLSSDEFQFYCREMITSIEQLREETVHPVGGILKIHSESRILPRVGNDGFTVDLRIDSPLVESLHVDTMRAIAIGGRGQELIFTTKDCTILPGITHVSLVANTNTSGTFAVQNIEVCLGKLVLRQLISPQKLRGYKIYPKADAFHITARAAVFTRLGSLRSLVLEIHSGRNDIGRLSIRLRSGTAGLRLHTGDVERASAETSIADATTPGFVHCTSMAAQKTTDLHVPYSMENEMPKLSVRIDAEYHTSHGIFSFNSFQTIDVALPVLVKVQDIFKRERLFSKFSISCAESGPVRILGLSLQGHGNYEVQSGHGIGDRVTVFKDQRANYTFAITRKQAQEQQPKDTRPPLLLTVRYVTIAEELAHIARLRLWEKLVLANLQDYWYHLRPIVETFALPEKEYDQYALAGRVPSSTLLLGGADASFTGLEAQERRRLEDCFENLFEIGDEEKYPKVVPREVVIPVDVPQLQYLHTVTLRYDSKMSKVGEPLHCRLEINSTSIWASSEFNGQDTRDFSFEVVANPSEWLIGGLQIGHFHASETTKSFPISLIAVTTGYLSLPTVEVRSIHGDVSSETDYKNIGVKIPVLPAKESVEYIIHDRQASTAAV